MMATFILELNSNETDDSLRSSNRLGSLVLRPLSLKLPQNEDSNQLHLSPVFLPSLPACLSLPPILSPPFLPVTLTFLPHSLRPAPSIHSLTLFFHRTFPKNLTWLRH